METDCRRLARTKRFVSLTIQPGDFLSQVDSNNRQIGTQKQLYKIENGFILNLIFSLSVGIFFVNITHVGAKPALLRRLFYANGKKTSSARSLAPLFCCDVPRSPNATAFGLLAFFPVRSTLASASARDSCKVRGKRKRRSVLLTLKYDLNW